MGTKDLELAVRDIIERLYNVEYIGRLKVSETFYKIPGHPEGKDHHLGFKLELGLNKDECPVSLACDGTIEQFLKFIYNELKNNRYHYTDYFTANKLYFNRGCCEEK